MNVQKNNKGGWSISVNGQLVGNYITKKGAQAVADLSVVSPGALREFFAKNFGE